MDIFDEDLRKSHSRRLMLGYFLFAVIVGITTWLLLLSAQGYKFDPNKGVTQNALIYVDSKPVSALVSVDGNSSGDKTDVKLSLPVGRHTIKLESEKYRTWTKEIDLESQAVEFLTYIKLFPASIVTEDVVSLEQKPLLLSSSPDGKWLTVVVSSDPVVINVYNANKISDAPKQFSLALPTSLSGSTVSSIEWSRNSNAFLLGLSSGGSPVDNILVDRNVGTIQILGSLISTSLHDLQFSKNGSDEILGIDNNSNLIRIALNGTPSASTLSARVVAFSVDNDSILALRKAADLKQNELTIIAADNSIKLLTTLPESIDSPKVKLLRYDGAENAVIAFGGQNKLLHIYRNPITQIKTLGENNLKPTIALRLDSTKQLLVSPNNRFVGVFGDGFGMVYDQDLQNLNRFNLEVNGISPNTIEWIDGFRLSYNVSGSGFVCDYDGINQQSLVSLNQDFLLQKNEDFKNVYSVEQSSTTGTFSIQSSDLVAD